MAEPGEELEWLILLIDAIPTISSLLLITVAFGTILFFFTEIYDFKARSDASDTHYWLRSFGVAMSAALVFILFQFLFGLLLILSPLFYSDIPVNLMNAVLSTNINAMIQQIISNPNISVLVLLGSMIFIIVIIMSYIMLGVYHVNFGWTTLLTWSAIATYFFVDLVLVNTIYEGGVAGILSTVGNSIRDALRGALL